MTTTSRSLPGPRIAIETLPECAFFGIRAKDFEDDSWRRLVDVLAGHGMYNLLTVTMRVTGHPITDPETRALFERLVAYAGARGLGVALDLDPRLARAEFKRRYPDECQRIVYLSEMTLDGRTDGFVVEPETFRDHMTGRGTPYLNLSGCLVKAWAFKKNSSGEIISGSVADVTSHVHVTASNSQRVAGRPAAGETLNGYDTVMAAVEFTLFTPDVFSPHLVAYQRELLDLYGHLPLKGVVKDEWGFPSTRQPMMDGRAFWYSAGYADAYARHTNGRKLLDDLLLMALPWAGRDSERLRAINRYMDLNLRRNAEIETRYYQDVKEVFGADAFVAKHPTWYPRLNEKEIYKNGLSWWAAKRDWAQTDEITPLSACTALSKKFGSPNWLNECYADNAEIYRRNIWRYAAAGGRMVFHPIIGLAKKGKATEETARVLSHGLLLTSELIRAQCRVRLLNLISAAPLDCPVAWVFGHPGMMNRAAAGYLDYGEELTLDLWRRGHAVDLYPSSEIPAGTFKVTDRGEVAVGRQHYKVLVLYRPDLCQREVASFFADNQVDGTRLFVIGDWARDFDGAAFDGLNALGRRVKPLAAEDALPVIEAALNAADAPVQPPLTEPFMLFRGNMQIGIPAPSGTITLTDGTVARLAATRVSDAGDPIDETLAVRGVLVEARAEGLFAVRLDRNGQVEALAAGGLSRVRAPGLELSLDTPLDMALWRDDNRKWHGAVQGMAGEMPEPPAGLCDDWIRLTIPEPYAP